MRRELGSQDFKRLLACLDPDPERASAQYKHLRDRLVRYCYTHDEHLKAEELADKALDEVAQKPDLENIRNLEQFAVGVLRLVLMAHKRRTPEQLPYDSDWQVEQPNPESAIVQRLDQERKEQCFLDCVKRLNPDEQRLIFEYYPNENRDLETRRRQLATTVGIEPGTLATRVNRLRGKLEKCCLACYRRCLAPSSARGTPDAQGY